MLYACAFYFHTSIAVDSFFICILYIHVATLLLWYYTFAQDIFELHF